MTNDAGLDSDQDKSVTSSSRAAVLRRFGGPEVLDVAPMPIPQPVADEVLVRVRAASINPVDTKTRQGEFPPVTVDKLPIILGRDLAGTIESCGTSAHNMLSHGDRVFAMVGQDRGAQSEYVVVKATELHAIPDNLDFVAAAAVPLAAITAWQGLFDHGGLEPAQRVLIHGGAGGVGAFAVQFARWKGAEVFATAGPDNQDYLRSLGANRAIDYKNEQFEEIATGIDLVLDLVDGETRERSWGVLREGGLMVSTLSEPDQAVAAVHKVRAAPRWMAEANATQLGLIADLIAAGTVTVTIAKTYSLDQVAAAHGAQEHGHPRGKIVLTL